MTAILELESTLTDRYQTTVPDAVRRALRLGKRDKICYVVQPDGTVVLKRAATAPEDDPALDAFLVFLARDIKANPARVCSLDAHLVKSIRSLVKGVKIDLGTALMPEDE